MEKYGNWPGETPAEAVANMLAFYEGEEVAKKFRNRLIEANEVIQMAFFHAKGAVVEKMNPEEYNLYSVQEEEKNGKKGHAIILGNNKLDGELIFGANADESGKNKAFLDYWCLRLNRAFVQGWAFSKGASSIPSMGYYEELDRLYKKAFVNS